MLRVGSALFDPTAEQGDFRFRQLVSSVRGRHAEVFIVRRDARYQLAFVRFARHDDHLAAISLTGGRLPVIQPQTAFSIRFIPSVTCQAMLCQQWSDITVEVNRRGRHPCVGWLQLVRHGRTARTADAGYQSHDARLQ